MEKFAEGFMLGAATAAHQVEGNNIYNDYWVQEQVPTQYIQRTVTGCGGSL